MKAALLIEPKKVAVREVDTPTCNSGYVLVQISHVGICGTDTKIFTGAICNNLRYTEVIP